MGVSPEEFFMYLTIGLIVKYMKNSSGETPIFPTAPS